MIDNKPIEQMSSDELFELAQMRQQQEEEQAREERKEKVSALRKDRREMLARHKKELTEIESQIEALTGTTQTTNKGSSSNVSAAVIEILSGHQQLTTKDIQNELSAAGMVAKNLSQTLAYLKRQGKITSPARSVYAKA